jgi:L-fuculose-phosphate aldolase
MTGNDRLRQALVDVGREINASGLSFGSSGNASVRINVDECLITPTGMSYGAMTPDDIVTLSFDNRYFGRYRPSSEWRFHRDIYLAREDVAAIVHTHSPFATALACCGECIPAFHYMVAVAGGADIRCAPYATFGTDELSDHAVKALEGRYACLLANHGQIALGQTLEGALKLAGEVETLAAQYWRACQGGLPQILDSHEMNRVLEKFQSYGSQDANEPDLISGGPRKTD